MDDASIVAKAFTLFDPIFCVQAVLTLCGVVSLAVVMRRLSLHRGETEGRWRSLRVSALSPKYWIAFVAFLVSGSPQDGTLRVAAWALRVCLVVGWTVGGLVVLVPTSWLLRSA